MKRSSEKELLRKFLIFLYRKKNFQAKYCVINLTIITLKSTKFNNERNFVFDDIYSTNNAGYNIRNNIYEIIQL